MALINGLKALIAIGHTGPVKICGDSKLVINQMKDRVHAKSDRIRSLYEEAMELVQQFERITWRQVPRKHNSEAEALSWQAYAEAWQTGPPLAGNI